MEAAVACLPICLPACAKATKLTLDYAVDICTKIRLQDPSVMDDLLNLIANMHKYKRKEQKMILKFMERYVEMNKSIYQSLVNTKELDLTNVANRNRESNIADSKDNS